MKDKKKKIEDLAKEVKKLEQEIQLGGDSKSIEVQIYNIMSSLKIDELIELMMYLEDENFN